MHTCLHVGLLAMFTLVKTIGWHLSFIYIITPHTLHAKSNEIVLDPGKNTHIYVGNSERIIRREYEYQKTIANT